MSSGRDPSPSRCVPGRPYGALRSPAVARRTLHSRTQAHQGHRSRPSPSRGHNRRHSCLVTWGFGREALPDRAQLCPPRTRSAAPKRAADQALRGADDGIRTRDPHLGNDSRPPLSCERMCWSAYQSAAVQQREAQALGTIRPSDEICPSSAAPSIPFARGERAMRRRPRRAAALDARLEKVANRVGVPRQTALAGGYVDEQSIRAFAVQAAAEHTGTDPTLLCAAVTAADTWDGFESLAEEVRNYLIATNPNGSRPSNTTSCSLKGSSAFKSADFSPFACAQPAPSDVA